MPVRLQARRTRGGEPDNADIFRELALAKHEPDIQLTRLVDHSLADHSSEDEVAGGIESHASISDSDLFQGSSLVFVLLATWDQRRAMLLKKLQSPQRTIKPILVVAHPDDLPVGLPTDVTVVSIDQIQSGRVDI